MKYLLRGGTVVTGEGTSKADVLVEGERIAAVQQGIEAKDAVIVDVTGRYLLPGFIDAHTHFDLEVAGTVTADDFSTGTKAAITGGTTCIIDFASQDKGQTLNEALEKWNRKAGGKASCDYGFHMAIADWNPHTAEELEDMFEKGITSFKVYMTYGIRVTDGEIYQVLDKVKEHGGIVGVHCENGEVIDQLILKQKKEGNFSPSAHPLSRPACIEAEAINRLLTIARLVDVPVVVVHLSSGEGYRAIQSAAETGQKVYIETCPQYLLMDDSKYLLPGFEGAKYVCSPPLRKKEDSEILWKALKEGRIHTIATDHCSFTTRQKEMGREDFTKIPNGMPGVETRAVLIYTYGVLEGRISLPQMCALLAENPAKLYGLYPEKGCIQSGADADIVVWDPEFEGSISAASQKHNVDYAPFEGFAVKGRAEKVFLRGEIIVDNGDIIKVNKGKYIARKKGSL